MPVNIKKCLERGIIGSRWLTLCSFSPLLDRILKESSKVFEDVLESFYSIDCIKSQFEAWRSKYFASYKDAYIGLCLPKLFNPLVRLQLLTWTPLEVSSSASSCYISCFMVVLSHLCRAKVIAPLMCASPTGVFWGWSFKRASVLGQSFSGECLDWLILYASSRPEFNLAHCQFLLREWCRPEGLRLPMVVGWN